MRLIDGSALEERCKRQMSDKWNKEAAPYSWANAYEQFLTDIENCATIDAVPVRHGRWIQNDNGTWSCNRCHSWIPDEQHYYAQYCLYCGSKMDGERKDGDA